MAEVDVSVVMGAYNGVDTLRDTLASILTQQDCAFEFVVVDDGSTDGTGQLLDDWAARDARLRVIHQPNAGLTAALVTGCAAARGHYIARQDVGDRSLPGRLAAQFRRLRDDPELAFVSCQTVYVAPRGEHLYTLRGSGLAADPIVIIDPDSPHGTRDGPTCHGSVMFQRDAYELAGGYRTAFYFGQDWDLWYRLGLAGKFQLVAEPLYEVCFRPGDLSMVYRESQLRLGALSHAALLARLRGEPEDSILGQARQIRPRASRRNRRRERASALYFLGECLRRNGNIAGARHYLGESVRVYPLIAKSWLRLAQTLRPHAR